MKIAQWFPAEGKDFEKGQNEMDTLIFFAQGFIGMFNKGGEVLMGWVTGIIPTLVCLLVAMNSIVLLVGNERI